MRQGAPASNVIIYSLGVDCIPKYEINITNSS